MGFFVSFNYVSCYSFFYIVYFIVKFIGAGNGKVFVNIKVDFIGILLVCWVIFFGDIEVLLIIKYLL